MHPLCTADFTEVKASTYYICLDRVLDWRLPNIYHRVCTQLVLNTRGREGRPERGGEGVDAGNGHQANSSLEGVLGWFSPEGDPKQGSEWRVIPGARREM